MHAKYTTYGLSWISKCWFNVSNDRKQLNSNLRGILYEIILKKKYVIQEIYINQYFKHEQICTILHTCKLFCDIQLTTFSKKN